MPLLELDGLGVRYGGAIALEGVTLTMSAAERVALVGANGAGKSTLLRAVLGLAPVTAGRIRLAGEDVTSLPTERRVRYGVGWVPEGRRVFAGMSVRDNLEVAGLPAAAARACDVERVLHLFPALRARVDQPAWLLSGGQQQMLAVGRALMGRPRLLLLDEPSLGLAPKVVAEVYDTLRELAASGPAVLLAEHSVRRALSLAPRAVVLRRGRTVLDTPAAGQEETILRDAFGVHGSRSNQGAATP